MAEGKLYAGVTKYYKDAGDDREASASWWLTDEADLHLDVVSVCTRIEKDMTARYAEWDRYSRLYTGRSILRFGLGPRGRQTSRATQGNSSERLTLNVIKSCVDTARAKIASKKPRALFLTKGGDYKLRERGKLATKYCEGLFRETELYPTMQRVFTDAAVVSIGVLKVFTEDDKVKAERVRVDEFLVDEEDARYGAPTQIHQRRPVPRAKVMAWVKGNAAKERIVQTATAIRNPQSQSVSDCLCVYESWKPATNSEAGDGVHALCIEGLTIYKEPWEHTWMPFVVFRWNDDLDGFYGIGLAEELVGLQIEINRVLRQVSRAIEGCVPRAFIPAGSKIVPGTLTDEIWSICRYQGQPPTFSTPSALSPEVTRHLADLYSKAYEITGISQMSAQAKKEPGLDSGIAIREANDIASERFLCTSQRYEDAFMRVADVMVQLTRELAEKNPKLAIKVKDGKSSRDLRWLKDINLEEDAYLMSAYPVAFLPTTPAGQLQYIQDLIKTGLVTSKERILQILDYPDLEEFLSLETIGLDYAQRCISLILDDGKNTPVSDFMNLELSIQIGHASVLRAEEDGRPQERIDMLIEWIAECESRTKALQPPPAPPPMPPGAPMGPPGAPPMMPPPGPLAG